MMKSDELDNLDSVFIDEELIDESDLDDADADGIDDIEDVDFDFDADKVPEVIEPVIPDAFARARAEMGEEEEINPDDFDDEWDEDFEEDADENNEDDLQLFKTFADPVKQDYRKAGRPRKNDNNNPASVGDTRQEDSTETNGTEEI